MKYYKPSLIASLKETVINALAAFLSASEQEGLADFRNKLQNCAPRHNEDPKINRIYEAEWIINPSCKLPNRSIAFHILKPS